MLGPFLSNQSFAPVESFFKFHNCVFFLGGFSQRENRRSAGHGPVRPSWPPMMPFGPPVSFKFKSMA